MDYSSLRCFSKAPQSNRIVLLSKFASHYVTVMWIWCWLYWYKCGHWDHQNFSWAINIAFVISTQHTLKFQSKSMASLVRVVNRTICSSTKLELSLTRLIESGSCPARLLTKLVLEYKICSAGFGSFRKTQYLLVLKL